MGTSRVPKGGFFQVTPAWTMILGRTTDTKVMMGANKESGNAP